MERRKLFGGLLLAGIVLLASYLLGFFTQTDPTRRPFHPPVLFMDEETGAMSPRSWNDVPPLPGKSARPTLVRTRYGVGADGQRQLLFLEKYTPAAKALVERVLRGGTLTSAEQAAVQAGYLVRQPAPGSPWVSGTSPEGGKIVQPFPGVRVENPNP